MRNNILIQLYDMARSLAKNYDYEVWNKMWTICSDWNGEHEDEEIFMCEDRDEEGNFRYYIEDDYFYLGE